MIMEKNTGLDDLINCEFLIKYKNKPKLEWLQENVDVNALDVMIENLYEKFKRE